MNKEALILFSGGKDSFLSTLITIIEAIWREFINLYYNNKLSENLKQYGDITISQFNCLSCRLAMYVMSIIIAKQKNIKLVVD